ncbi:hypothetical protein [Methyloligella solikamskensis]|uniref:Uncharacterized protein n=1 Tax=Methyloligella solikamskensis TaxID=1177756 RepID=A0ABW3JAF2_9HYPH
MSNKGPSPFVLHSETSGRFAADEVHGAPLNVLDPNVLEFGPRGAQLGPRYKASESGYAAPQSSYATAQAWAAQPAQQPFSDPMLDELQEELSENFSEDAFETAWTDAEDAFPQGDLHYHPHLDQPLEPLSNRLDRIGTPSGLELIHSEMLDRYAEAEAEQTEEAETDWYASRIAGARSWASMEKSLDHLITDYEKRHHQANLYVAGGIGGAVVLTLIALSAFLSLSS